MKHHFADFLEREGGYWKMVPNDNRYSYYIEDVPAGDEEISIATIGSEDENWQSIFTFPNLEELTLHEPSKEQVQSVSKLTGLKRLRITHARPKTIEFISTLTSGYYNC